ncbi:hypothetical protein D3C87_931530 [compost metagenome]
MKQENAKKVGYVYKVLKSLTLSRNYNKINIYIKRYIVTEYRNQENKNPLFIRVFHSKKVDKSSIS